MAPSTQPRSEAAGPGGALQANPVGAKRSTVILGLLIRGVAAVIIVAAPFVQTKALLWPAIVILVFTWLTSWLSRVFCRWHYDELYELRADTKDGEDDDAALPGVTVIAPARNEEEGIEEAARSLGHLDYPNIEIIIVNDHSTDGTRALLERVQSEIPKVRVLHDPPLQEGWLGKANAVWFAVQHANPDNKWLVLTDGDVVFEPKTIRRAVAHAEAAGWDFFTCVPFLDNGSFSEELLLPHAWRDIIVASSLRLLNKPEGRPIGIGAFILVKRAAYLESGGHSAIRNQQPEDTLLGGVVKKWGGKIGVGWTSSMLRVRLYRGYAQLRSFLVRKTRVAVDDSLLSLASRALYCWLLFVLPIVLGTSTLIYEAVNWSVTPLMACYTLAALGVYVDVARAMRQASAVSRMRPGLPWIHPLGGLLRFWLTVVAMGQVLAKKRMDWRGRDFSNVRAEKDAPTG
ncbi:MAG: glycosyltransferase [Candidatus Hydrogenedentes bacterium]|nr:glycosyltransferase [Candidatus Hydrogenedentota bacterium]